MESDQSGRSSASFNRFGLFTTDLHCGALSTRRKLYRNVQRKRWGEAFELKVHIPQILFACNMIYSFYVRFDGTPKQRYVYTTVLLSCSFLDSSY